MKVNLVTPWKMTSGIADDSRYLVPFLRKKIAVRVIEIEKPQTKNPFYFYRLAKKASKDCDIIHIQHEFGLFGKLLFSGIFTPIFYLSLDRSKKIITTVHEFRRMGGLLNILRKWSNHLIFQRSDTIHVHTSKAENELRGRVPKEKIRTIPLGIYDKRLIRKKEECKKTLGLAGKKVILFFGLFIHKEKGYDTIMDVLPRLDKDTVLLVLGEPMDQGYLQQLKAKAKNLSMEKKVIFHGKYNEEQVPTFLNAADIAVLPYKKATQSGAINPLLAYGIPTITSDIEFFREINREYSCFLIFRSKEELEQLIKKTLKKGAGKALEKNMKRFVSDRSPERIVGETIKMYGP